MLGQHPRVSSRIDVSSATGRTIARPATFPARTAANVAAPAPSTTAPHRRARIAIAAPISLSVTLTTSSMREAAIENVISPTRATASPSAIVALALRQRPARSHRRTEAGGVLRLDRDHSHVRSQRFDHGRDTRQQPAPSHGNHEGVQLRGLLEYLQRHRALTCDHPRIVEGMDKHAPDSAASVFA